MEKKKILILTGWLPGGGAERVLIDILRNIDYTKYDIDLALFEKKGELMKDVPSEVNIIELWGANSLHHFLAIKATLHLHSNYLLSQRINSRRLGKDYDAEIAFLEGMPVKLISMRKTKAPKFCWIHVDLSNFHASKSAFYNSMEEFKSYNSLNKIICVSEDCRKGFISCFPSMEPKTSLLYNPIDKDNIIALSKKDGKLKDSDGKINIVIVARLHSQKNPHRIIEVAELAKKEGLNLKFHWIGNGPLMEELINLRDEKGLTEMISFYGFKENPYPYIAQADMMVLPSDAEGFGLVLCEAMCLGVPVISTPTAGPKEIIGNNEFGILSDFSPESILEAIKTIINDNDLRNKLIEAGRERVDSFSVEQTMSHFNHLIG